MKSDRLYLEHILQVIERIEGATREGKAAFLESQLHQDAVLRNLHTMTETAQRLSGDLKSRHPEVEWAKLAAFRNVLVHDYLGIDTELIWIAIAQDVPQFKAVVTQMLDSVE